MSMNATFVQVDAGELSRLQADPSSVEVLFQSGVAVPEAFIKLSKAMEDRVRLDPSLRQMLAGGIGGDDLLKLMEQRRSRASARSSSTAATRAVLSLDKAWHGVHYVLCGQSEPGASLLSQPVLGGTILGDDDEGFSGYGPARYFTAAQVAELAGVLNRPEIESEAASRFDAERMSGLEIYPGWRSSDSEWLMDEFRRLCDFYADAAAKGNAIVTCLYSADFKYRSGPAG
jgi:hypothetical protein